MNKWPSKSPILNLVLLVSFIRSLSVGAFWVVAHFRHRHFLTIFARWDAQWYQSIAEGGYGFQVRDRGKVLSNEAFFPLFPFLEKIVHKVSSLGYLTSGVLLSLACSLWAAIMIYKVTELISNRSVAFTTALIWSVYPISYVDNLAYSETLFTALAASALYCSQKHWIKSASTFALLAGLTRPTGLALAAAVTIPIIIEMISSRDARRSFTTYFAIVIPASGWLSYFFYLACKNSNFFSYFEIQAHWGNGFDGGENFFNWIASYIFSKNWFFGLFIVIGCLFIIYLLLRLYKRTKSPQILIFTTLMVVLSFTTQGYFGSKPRYLLPLFPLMMVIAIPVSEKSRVMRFGVLAALTILGLSYGAIAATGHGPP